MYVQVCLHWGEGDFHTPWLSQQQPGASRGGGLAFTLAGYPEQAHPPAGHLHSLFAPQTPSWLLVGLQT